MPAQITLVRHAETAHNAERRWQGSTDAPLNERGQHQVGRLAERLRNRTFDVVVTSDLSRAADTAAALSADFVADARWREPHVGEWEGMTHKEIEDRYPGELKSLIAGEDVALGGGERMSDVAARLRAAFADLTDRLGDDGEALVVSHGLSLLTLIAGSLDAKRPTPMRLMANTGISQLSVNAHGPQLTVYNDVGHLGENGRVDSATTDIVLIRHGETQANVELRWQGHGDWPLNDVGRAQARTLPQRVPQLDALYSSPLQRARDTAKAVAHAQSLDVVVDDRLKEMGFGLWENRTKAEIEEQDPEAFARLQRNDLDVRRGGSGETFSEVQDRITEAIDEIASRHQGGTVGVVSHGGASRAYVTRLLGLDFRGRFRLGSLANTGIGRVQYGARGKVLAHWNSLA